MSSRKRKPPRPHKVDTKHPRYNVNQYNRGSGYSYPSSDFRSLKTSREDWIAGLDDTEVAVEAIKATSQYNQLLRDKKYQRGAKRELIEEKIFQTQVRQDALKRALRDRGIDLSEAMRRDPEAFEPWMDALGRKMQLELKEELAKKKRQREIDEVLPMDTFHEINVETNMVARALLGDPDYRDWYRENVKDPEPIIRRFETKWGRKRKTR